MGLLGGLGFLIPRGSCGRSRMAGRPEELAMGAPHSVAPDSQPDSEPEADR